MKQIGMGASLTLLAAGLCALPASLPAAAISGTFNLDGVITVTGSTITWQSNSGVANQATIAAAGLSGAFAGLGDTLVTISNLSNPPETVGGPFPAAPFISFNAAPTLPSLMINNIFAGPYSSAQCGAAPAAGQTCTPPIPGGSPFGLTNLGTPGGLPTGSSAAFAFSGVTSDGLSKWTGNLTSQFSVPFQTVLAELAASGSVTNTYSGTFVVSVIPTPTVPEPATFFLLGGSLIGLALIRRRKAVN